MSWYNSYGNKLNLNNERIDKFLEYFQTEEIQNEDNVKEFDLFIEKANIFLDKDLNILSSLELLEEESYFIKILSKYILQNNYIDTEFFKNCIKILTKLSSILMQKLKQCEIVHKNKNFNNYIPRCSYKFCSFKEDCFYNYSNKTKNICYQDHYVHNMVLADLLILDEYVNKYFNNNKILIPNKEILKSINTLSFVIDHMYLELKSRCLYLNKDQIENEHFIKKNNS